MRDRSLEFVLPQEGSRLPSALSSPGTANGQGGEGAPQGEVGTTDPAATGQQPSSTFFQPLILFGVLFLFMWFFVIRPERRRQRERASMLGAVKKGDMVVTSGGIHGQVAAIDENHGIITLKVDDNMRLKFEKAAIARIVSPKGDKESGHPGAGGASSAPGNGTKSKKSKPALAGSKK